MSEPDFDVVVIGGGQAGLAMGYYLREQGRRFAIVERGDSIAPAWRERWDSLTLSRRAATARCRAYMARRLQSSADRLRSSSPRHNALIRRSDRMVSFVLSPVGAGTPARKPRFRRPSTSGTERVTRQCRDR